MIKTKGEKSIDKIINAAIAEFAKNGYAGASISQIAKKAGLVKSSLYSHFESKSELFSACIEVATDRRFSFLKKYIDKVYDEPIDVALYGFLLLYDDLGGEESDAYFHERFAYFPPEDLKDEITNFTSNVIIVQVREILEPIFIKWADENNVSNSNMVDAIVAFLSMYDGIIVERLIGNQEKFRYRLEHSWRFFQKALNNYTKSTEKILHTNK